MINEIGWKVQQMRKALGLTQTEFGILFDVHYSTVGHWERNGTITLSMENLKLMVDANLNPLFFLGHGDYMLDPEPWSEVHNRVNKSVRKKMAAQ